MQAFANPTHTGTVPDANRRSRQENPVCGDVLQVTARVSNVIEEVRFQAQGCPPLIAAGSLLCGWLEGRPPGEGAELTEERLERMLGGVPAHKRHALTLARLAAEEICSIPEGAV